MFQNVSYKAYIKGFQDIRTLSRAYYVPISTRT